MDELKVTRENALAAHAEANQKGKALLENLFGKKVFQREVTERIKTFDDVLDELGISAVEFAAATKGLSHDEIAYRQIKLIVQALNEGWQPDWTDSDRYKYYPWFDLSSGRGLSYNACAYGYARSGVGSRLCFKSRELAEYAGTQFKDLYEDYFLIRP